LLWFGDVGWVGGWFLLCFNDVHQTSRSGSLAGDWARRLSKVKKESWGRLARSLVSREEKLAGRKKLLLLLAEHSPTCP